MSNQVLILRDDKNVSVNNVYRTVQVVDNNRPENILNVTQPVTSFILVSAGRVLGDKGDQGPPGSFPTTGSYNLSGSITANSFTGSLQGTSSYALTASFALNSPKIGLNEVGYGKPSTGEITSSLQYYFTLNGLGRPNLYIGSGLGVTIGHNGSIGYIQGFGSSDFTIFARNSATSINFNVFGINTYSAQLHKFLGQTDITGSLNITGSQFNLTNRVIGVVNSSYSRFNIYAPSSIYPLQLQSDNEGNFILGNHLGGLYIDNVVNSTLYLRNTSANANGVIFSTNNIDRFQLYGSNRAAFRNVNVEITGSFSSTSYYGTGSRLVEADATGSTSAQSQIITAYLTNSTIIGYLTTGSSWSAGLYVGPVFTGSYQGQFYNSGSYFYFAIADDLFLRMQSV